MILFENRTKRSSNVNFYRKVLLVCKKFLIVLILVALLVNYLLSKNASSRSLSIDISGTLHKAVNSSFDYFGNFWSNIIGYFGDVKTLKLENQKLSQKVLQLTQEINDLSVIQDQNQELRKLLNFISGYKAQSITAQLISITTNPEGQYGLINCGKKHSVSLGDTVVCDQGFIGKIIQVGDYYSKVLLITNSKLRIPVRSSSGQKGILKGDPDQPYISYIARPDKVNTDELLFTSLDSANLIADIPIGRIAHMSNKVLVKPNTKLEDLRFISVLKKP
ncbi:hypothetical protein phytr_11840 [Candidatus Phycorickettsia trachydisci]|uniref:Cell shape-determining protein MreC n=1 Tax=Candidatus Phycorickettsia trachydisci TaxID=2115978 RepID=A0A2P1PA26_9RICK|nr:rod shape-determining protein MreC [Candidatus Phycorickettsia trachydisci]AVP88109.1 hypothetical protein phytr_11840 [Candidatus Phycorickettsia trachydisci]